MFPNARMNVLFQATISPSPNIPAPFAGIAWRAAAAAGAISLSEIASERLIYQMFIVPRLDQWVAVPMWVWTIMWSPVLIVGLVCGAYLANRRQVIVAGVLAAATTQVYEFVSAMQNAPGHLKSWASEAPFLFWTVGTAFGAVMLIALFSAGVIARRVVIRVAQ